MWIDYGTAEQCSKLFPLVETGFSTKVVISKGPFVVDANYATKTIEFLRAWIGRISYAKIVFNDEHGIVDKFAALEEIIPTDERVKVCLVVNFGTVPEYM